MFIYRLVTPIDDFDELVALPDWLRDAPPASIAWILTAVLALQDGADQVGWRGDMRHLPSVGIPSDGTANAAHLVVKQDDNGATFVISSAPLPWADALTSVQAVTTPRRITPVTHPTAADIAEASTDIVRPIIDTTGSGGLARPPTDKPWSSRLASERSTRLRSTGRRDPESRPLTGRWHRRQAPAGYRRDRHAGRSHSSCGRAPSEAYEACHRPAAR